MLFQLWACTSLGSGVSVSSSPAPLAPVGFEVVAQNFHIADVIEISDDEVIEILDD